MKHVVTILFAFLLLSSIKVLGQETFRDNFSLVSYSNNDGTQTFATDWTESGDTDLGPTGNYIYINNGRLYFYYLWSENITREANLSGATSGTLSFSWRTSGLNGGKALQVEISNNGGSSFTSLGSVSGNNSSGNFSTSISAYISSNTVVRFRKSGNNWDNNDSAYIDNFQISVDQLNPSVKVEDIAVDENIGAVVLTVTHDGAPASGPFTVNYTTVDGTASAGSDYTSTTGTLNFSGVSGDTDTITVPITDDGVVEDDETFIIQFTSSSDGSVDYSDTATVTINSQIPYNEPLALYEQFAGYVDYTSTGGTFRTADNNTDPCAVTTTSSGTLLSTIPSTATISKAYLYWAHSSFVTDSNITFEGQNVSADLIYESGIIGRTFYGYVSDVTSIIEGIGVANLPSTTFDVTDLTIDSSNDFCSTATVLGGWSLMIFYEDNSLPSANINLYLGFNGLSNAGTSFTLDSFYAIAGSGSKASFLSWEGDSTLDGSSSGSTNPEELSITNQLGTNFVLSGDGGNPGNNAYNSTAYDNTQSPVVNINTLYGLDWDTFDISSYIAPTDTQVTANVDVGQDFVISNAVVLKVPSNLVTGYVFEDINYPGGAGRSRSSSGGIGISGVTVELYNSANMLISTTTTNSNGNYVFGGMADGTYSIRVVNGTVTSTRGGGSSCSTCLPVQTFRSYNIGGGITSVTDEVGGANPSQTDVAAGTLTGAQSVSQVLLASNGVVGIDFGFNFNTIVNTNEDGQGSLEQFIVNSNNLDETGLDIEANASFDPAVSDDTSIFMIPTSSDPLGRTADANYASGYFDISISNGNPLSSITSDNTKIDGRTQTAYSGDTNVGTVAASESNVGTSATTLPDYNLPEIQVHGSSGDVFITTATNVSIRNLSVYANNNSGIRVDGGLIEINGNLIGVNALGTNAGNINIGIENAGGNMLVYNNYIATNIDTGIVIDAGTSNVIQNNHITSNGDASCDDNILINSGSGIVIQQNLIENAASLGIDAAATTGNLIISENTITGSGQDGGNCVGMVKNMGIELGGSNSQITNNVIHSNGGAGLATTGIGTGNLISQNSFYANGTAGDALGIDLNGDGVTLNDSGDGDSGSNNLNNFPVINTAFISGSNIIVSGWSRPGATVEFFLTDINEGTAASSDNQVGYSLNYGEGQIYMGSAVEGSGSDQDSTSSSYSDADGNIDNTNRFKFTIPLPSGTVIGETLTATATLSNSTSEFGPIIALKVSTIITNRRITYRVNPN